MTGFDLVVRLATSPSQHLQGFSDSFPLVAHSVARAIMPSGTPIRPEVYKWLGVPFATAKRWAKSVPFAAASDAPQKRECYEFGPVPFQPAGIVEKHWVNQEGWLNRDFVGQSEDCLSLNVFAPAKAVNDGRKLPVLVWCYGGALNTGHSAAIRHDATELVRLAEEEGNPVIGKSCLY